MIRSTRPEPENPVQPLRVIAHGNDHREAARAAGIDDLMEFRAIYTSEVLLQVALAGPEDGEPVVLLHGFPDFWLSWARQVRFLVEAGYRVIIPDQRGYNLSEKPPDVGDYHLRHLAQDILDCLDALGHDRAHLVGHDWGGAVSWWLAEHHPRRFLTLTVFNCPPAEVLAEAIKREPRQMLRSWYIAYFQIPRLPELMAATGNYRALEKALLTMSMPGSFSEAELAAYRKAWSRPGALRAMINWYRAARDAVFAPRDCRQIEVPTTIIWGERDAALHPLLIEKTAARCKVVDVHALPEAKHWVHRDCPDEVNPKLLESLRGASVG